MSELGYDEDKIGQEVCGQDTAMYKEFIMAGGGSHWWNYRCYIKREKASGFGSSDWYEWKGNTIINKDGEHPCGDLYYRREPGGKCEYLMEINSEEELKEANEEVKKFFKVEYNEDDVSEDDDFYFIPFAVKGEECYIFDN